ncbi:biotin--acetyl-CoA-carboxylase ligase [Erythrobacter sp. KY5]|uniref:PAS domain-containing protein n=1 Tax=Erythrobacter sp. KY5 TaxID=2011159 RepID=UPI000DBF37B2|nr:PAS domain-containing protein [Erythrobacter sp. KY5]AWW75269.1 biotin--acetyl-CoA-carboxylase ligase [Erythrobacter sp. KY5]
MPPELSEARLGEAIAKLPFSMVLASATLEDQPILYINERFTSVTGYSEEMTVGRNCRFLQGEETDPKTVAKIRAALENGEDITVDLANYRADGSMFMNRLLISPIRNDEGEVVSFLGIQRDLTGQIEELPAGSDDVLMSELQHRVKNHLAMIVGLIRMHESSEASKEALAALSSRVQSLALLYEELSGSGVATISDDQISAGAYISRVAAALGSIDGRKAIRMNVDCDQVSLPVNVATTLGLLVTEFLTNSLEHAFVGRDLGMIRVRLENLAGGLVRLTVEDDGVGLPEGLNWPRGSMSLRERRKAMRAQGEGERRGLGGAMVNSLVDSIGGKLSVGGTDHGTIIVLDLPPRPTNDPE